MAGDIERTTIRVVAWRLLPLVFLLYLSSLIDRTNLGGVVGPVAIGWAKTATNSFAGGLYFIAGSMFVAAMIIAFAIKPALSDRVVSPGEAMGGALS